MVNKTKSATLRKITKKSPRSKNPKSAFNLKSTKSSHRKTSIQDFRFDIRKLILSIVVINIVIVIIAIVAYFQLKPDYRIPATIDNLAAKYYENNFYEKLVTSDQFSGDPEDALGVYTKTGLTPVTLHQLLIQTKADQSTRSYLEKYCDTDTTTVTFYPDSPFSRTSYHYKIYSSCDID